VIRVAAALILTAILAGCGVHRDGTNPQMRAFPAMSQGRWIGNAVCYGPHRDGQRPGGSAPTTAQVREDLHLMLPYWNLMRIYGSTGAAETILQVIRADELDMKVMLGVWIAPEAPEANRREVESAIHLATAYEEVVTAIAVGNETQVSWSAHRSCLDSLITYVRRVRSNTRIPITVADDFNFWNKPESQRLAAELDFLTVHAHPMWNGKQLDEALPWVVEQLAAVQELHPGSALVLGETGWATSVHSEGEQADLIQGRPGVAEQKFFFDHMRAWADSTQLVVFFFEAFDENWKGGSHPAEVEKHWGLFRADRSLKSSRDGDGTH
jgi:exo-beta-1,3-glucanase (GH17 family)